MYYVLTETQSFEIASEDLPEKMEWLEALEASRKVGDRWRMPNLPELELMYVLHQKAIGNFKNDTYLSSEGVNKYTNKSKSFISGTIYGSHSTKRPVPKEWVRLVRNI
ncbi:MAG: hypothetical protein HKP45_07745 [Winogradskyella sp.]|nr:hypothetical protein [Winogradskyella sp.]